MGPFIKTKSYKLGQQIISERVNREITNFHLLRWRATKVVKVVVYARTHILLSLPGGGPGGCRGPNGGPGGWGGPGRGINGRVSGSLEPGGSGAGGLFNRLASGGLRVWEFGK